VESKAKKEMAVGNYPSAIGFLSNATLPQEHAFSPSCPLLSAKILKIDLSQGRLCE